MIGNPGDWFVIDSTREKFTGPFTSEVDAMFALQLACSYGMRGYTTDYTTFNAWLTHMGMTA